MSTACPVRQYRIADFLRCRFFDQNPMSQLAVVAACNGVAEKLTTFTGTARRHNIQVIKALESCTGEASVQNAVDLACEMLNSIPKYGTREVLCLWASLNTIDPGDVFASVRKLKEVNVRACVVSLSAELYVLRHLAESTNGTMSTVQSLQHLKELLMAMVPPAPKLRNNGKDPEASMIHMGFPVRVDAKHISVCSSTGEIRAGGYLCPQCKAKVSELPTSCKVCNLPLVSSPHLARSYHHLFPVMPFNEVQKAEPSRAVKTEGNKITISRPGGNQALTTCSACRHLCRDVEMAACPKCRSKVCLTCDAFIHESLHVCPGCEIHSRWPS